MSESKRPYSESYLQEVMETQGKFFERLQDEPEPIDSEDMITAYLNSDTRRQLDEGHAYYLTLNADDLKRVFLEESGYQPKSGEPLRGFMPNWIGQFYAYAQWKWGVLSREIIRKLPVRTMRIAYPGIHDLDMSLAVERTEKWCKRGSALLVVLGMLAFMVVSATAFSIYMRQNRMPSSFLRQRSAASMLVKAALAEAMHEIDVAIGKDPYPNEYVKASNGLRFNVQSRDEKRSDETEIYNTWRNRVYIGTRSLSGSEDDGIDEKNTVSVLNLEGLAYLPPPLVNTVRYWARRSESARWQTLDFDSGRYAFTAVNVSDYLDINRLVADRMRDSSPSNRITLAYRFGNNTSRMQAFDTAINAFKTDTDYGRLVSLADYNMAMGDKSGKVKSPKKGSLDYVSPFMSYITGNAAAGFYDNVTEADAAEQTFVTDSWYPYVATSPDNTLDASGNNASGKKVIFLSDETGFFFTGKSGQAIAGNLKELQMMGKADSPFERIQRHFNYNLITLASLYDYLDCEDGDVGIPVSLCMPTTERAPMMTGIQLEAKDFKLKFKHVVGTAQETENQRITPHQWVFDGLEGSAVFTGSAVYPFKCCSGLGTPPSFTVQVLVKGFLTPDDADFSKSRLEADFRPTEAEWQQPNNQDLGGLGYFTMYGEQSKTPQAKITDKNQTLIDITGLTMVPRVKADGSTQVYACQVVEEKDEDGNWVQTKDSPIDYPDGMPRPLSYQGADGKIALVSKSQNSGQSFKMVFLTWVRIKGPDGIVDLVPATYDDDNRMNNVTLDSAASGNSSTFCGADYPVIPVQGAAGMLVLSKTKFGENGGDVASEAAGGGLSIYCNDPRYNFAPEDWYTIPGGGGVQASDWLNRVEIGIPAQKNTDIFQFVSNRGYLQSVGELQFLPYVQEILSNPSSDSNPWTGREYLNAGKYNGKTTSYADRTGPADLANKKYMWQTYWAFDPTYKSGVLNDSVCDKTRNIYKMGIVDTRGGVSIPPYTASDELFLAGLADTPFDWAVADTENGYKSDKIKELTFNENNSEAKMTEKQLKDIADYLRSQFCKPAYYSATDKDWEYSEFPGWGKAKFCDTLGEADGIHDVDRKFLFSYWKNCFANNQQLFLVFVRAEPTMMTGEAGSDRTPSQLGARAMALVWRDPASSLTAHDGEQHPPHTMRILFYHQFE